MVLTWGSHFGPPLESFWGPLGAEERLQHKVIPPEVSSRESTVLHVFHSSFLAPILEPFWLRFGCYLELNAAQKTSESTPRFWVSFWIRNGSQKGVGSDLGA